MRFGPWYPLADAGTHAPAAEGVLQLRLADGVLDYPRGKSAMVHYAHAADVRAAAIAFATGYQGPPLVCRHLDPEGEAVDLATFHAKVLHEFVNRFGSSPSLPSEEGLAKPEPEASEGSLAKPEPEASEQ